MSVPHFRIPLNIPHAATVAARIQHHLATRTKDEEAVARAGTLVALLLPYLDGENPEGDERRRVIDEAARLAREIVGDIERLGCGHDRLGQAVRNLFECLGLGEEGATISLRAGENPDSALRPR
jgi:hypothetical protein